MNNLKQIGKLISYYQDYAVWYQSLIFGSPHKWLLNEMLGDDDI